jgi:hypothetical protein
MVRTSMSLRGQSHAKCLLKNRSLTLGGTSLRNEGRGERAEHALRYAQGRATLCRQGLRCLPRSLIVHVLGHDAARAKNITIADHF